MRGSDLVAAVDDPPGPAGRVGRGGERIVLASVLLDVLLRVRTCDGAAGAPRQC
jgi:hypothetical protein